MPRRITVVVSQGQSNHPAKRQVEEEIVAGLLGEQGVDVTLVPHLYDLAPDGSGMLCLQGIGGDMIVCSWLYPRAAHWILDRNGVAGKVGATLIKGHGEDEEDDEPSEMDEGGAETERVIDRRVAPSRTIYCLDLRSHEDAATYVTEIKRIAAEASTETIGLMNWIGGSPAAEQMDRYLAPTGVESNGNGHVVAEPRLVDEQPGRRWYPVIDFSRCTNCLECIDFCLFGVYGVDSIETILVEQPDNCRKGCPACSRVCPENAIIFPQHKSPAIAGSHEVAGGLKIDLSALFGAPDEKPVDAAVRERDEQLMLAGRETVGHAVGIPKRQQDKPSEPKDDLDSLMDQLDELDL